ncbi:fatty acyl-AMP ligase [Streptomyces sp. NBC_01016]|uniref:fatty acyl-AMP ligase n=1 Tax=Streptomyces sp. NBC_01016 TaxID=2903720 RepID=UPI00225A1008|nr:fatty acyl-AMP ligase [Streptomyces sp. NBC_01016]MCX4830327.1 fatty acyl-AMP ligase [Streptomyces sp. NBC_01016]
MADLSGASNVVEILTEHARTRGDFSAVAIVPDPSDPATTQWVTYDQLDRAARGCAVDLLSSCRPGDRALLLLPNSAEFVVAVLGCFYAGLVPVPSSMPGRYKQDRRRVRAIARDAGIGAVLTGPDELDDVLTWAAAEDLDVPVLIPDVDPEPLAESFVPHAAAPHDLALLQYTSGSTSDPKGARVTHRNLLLNALAIDTYLPVREGQRYGGWIPNYHDMGLMGHILTPLLAGRGIALMTPAAFLRRPRAWLELVDHFDIGLSAAPNFAYELCLTRVPEDSIAGLDLSRWTRTISGSEPVKASVLQEFAERFAPAGLRPDQLTPCYGMAETTLMISTTSGRVPRVFSADTGSLEAGHVVPSADGTGRTLVSCGEPRHLEARIVDPATGEALPEGSVGEIWLRGELVVNGYWRNPEATEATFGNRVANDRDDAGAWLRTGDLGALVDGEIYVTGRIKEMMIVRGRNIYPHDIEHELRRQHEELRDTVGSVVSVAAGADDTEGRLVVIHEVRRRSPEEELARLAASMRLTVAREFGLRADAVLLMRRGAVRRTTSGKVQRGAMRSLYANGELEPLWADGYPAAQAVALAVGEHA